MYICSRVPTRCTALARTARQNSARPYYLRFVSWLQTITHFPGSSHLSPFPWLALYHPHSLRLFLSRRTTPSNLFICTATLSPPPAPRALFPFLYRIYSSLSAYGHVRTMQRSNGFVIELPSTANFILFWESADTHARTHVRTPRPCTPRRNEICQAVCRT